MHVNSEWVAESRLINFKVGFKNQTVEGYRKREAIAWMEQKFREGHGFEAYLRID